MQHNIIGWDIGGAHLKAAWLNESGDIVAVYQEPCALWQGLDVLETKLRCILNLLPDMMTQHVMTMTGELVDLFESKEQGVIEIISVAQALLGSQQTLLVYAGRLGFIEAGLVSSECIHDIASANWLASASYVAQSLERGLFVDVGSTTTDILLLANSQVAAIGYTDYQRLNSNELVYTGIVRTAVMAVVQSVCFIGEEVGVMSEYFATMADVYRLTGELNEQHDQMVAADGGEKNQQASAQRLARMIGCERQDFGLSDWQALANVIREHQLQRIQSACEKQLLRNKNKGNTQIIGAGVGRFLIRDIALNLGLEYQDFEHLLGTSVDQLGMEASDCAPAVAVSYLAKKHLTEEH